MAGHELDRATRCLQTKQRNAARKAARLAKIAARPKRSPREQLAHLDTMGFVATKERARLAKKLEN